MSSLRLAGSRHGSRLSEHDGHTRRPGEFPSAIKVLYGFLRWQRSHTPKAQEASPAVVRYRLMQSTLQYLESAGLENRLILSPLLALNALRFLPLDTPNDRQAVPR